MIPERPSGPIPKPSFPFGILVGVLSLPISAIATFKDNPGSISFWVDLTISTLLVIGVAVFLVYSWRMSLSLWSLTCAQRDLIAILRGDRK